MGISEVEATGGVDGHLQEHVDQRSASKTRFDLTDGSCTSNSRTVEGETELSLQPHETTVCDSQRGGGHHIGGEDAFQAVEQKNSSHGLASQVHNADMMCGGEHNS